MPHIKSDALRLPIAPADPAGPPWQLPKSGMTLEPLLPEAGRNDADPALATLQRHFWCTLPLALAVATLAMFGHRLGWMAMASQSWFEFALQTQA